MFRMRCRTVTLLLLFVLLLLALISAAGQGRVEGFGGGASFGLPHPSRLPTGGDGSIGEFTFVRAVYDSPHSPYNRAYGGAWRVDFPEADAHFVTGVREWAGTNLRVSPHTEQLRVTDERIFDHPLVYVVEPGHMELSDEEAASLREYLLRGGFLFLDDFHGDAEWERVRGQLKKVMPEYEVKDLPLTHPIFHSYFDISEVVQVPGVASLVRGVTYEKGGVTPHYMGLEDENGRLLIFLTRNCDLGDAWEWINDSRYPVRYGLVAYKVGVNVVTYAMSH